MSSFWEEQLKDMRMLVESKLNEFISKEIVHPMTKILMDGKKEFDFRDECEYQTKKIFDNTIDEFFSIKREE